MPIRKEDDGFSVSDDKGHYLGYTPNLAEAEFMAANGFIAAYAGDVASDLSLWVMWNDAVASNCDPLEDEEGTQYILLPGGMVMSAQKCDDGWDTAIYHIESLFETYGDTNFDGVLRLRIADKPFKLE